MELGTYGAIGEKNMPGRLDTTLGLFIAVALPPFTPSTATATGTSVCVIADQGCLAPGGIQVRLVIGQSDALIVGGQVAVKYDPQALRLIEAEPGRACDPASPFAFKLFDEDDPAIGQEICAIGINFLEGLPASTTSTTLACFSFAPLGNAKNATPICLMQGQHQFPFEAVLVDAAGHPVTIDNSQACPPGSPPPILACDEVMPGVNCNCVPGTADCHGLDTPCRTGVCNPMTTHCEVASINEGAPCDDGDSCTLVDRCGAGICVGEGCQNQSICASSSSCIGLDSFLTVKIRLSDGDHVVQGAQFSFEYDPTKLTLIDVSPGSTCDDSPFVSELAEVVDQAAGEVFYAVGVGLGGIGTRGPATLACLTFEHLGQSGANVCLFNDSLPFSTILVDELGRSVPTGNPHLCPSNREPPTPMCADIEPCIIPTVSEWGLVTMTLLLLTAAKILVGSARAAPMRISTDRSRE